MANLKDLKTRIKSVKSTQKITRAMKLVSASKLRRARENAERALPYATRMERVIKTLASNVSGDNAPKLLIGNGNSKVHLLIAVSSDRGLCGGFNANLTKAVKRRVSDLSAEGKEVKIICLGKKGYEILKTTHSSYIIDKTQGIASKKIVPFSDAEAQTLKILEMFEEGAFDVCTIFYNKFISAISQKVTAQQLIPLDLSGIDEKEGTSSVYEYEPSEAKILSDLLPRNISVQIYNAFLENSASEHGARMAAMDNATRNAGDMIKALTLQYNRSRQAVITKELLEIIAGAEAV
jgi:F-type H+-transporting ATPase subunit gamma